MCRRRGAGRELRKHEAAARHLGRERGVAKRISDVDPRAEDRDRAARPGQASAMGGGVDAERRPETMVSPASLSARAKLSALRSPWALALRLPTTASAGREASSMRPAA